MADMKKELQKAVKAFRDAQEKPSEYPKAMMTAQQMRRNTATVNCGRGDIGKERAERFINDPRFEAWCEIFQIKSVGLERIQEASYMLPQYQVRVFW